MPAPTRSTNCARRRRCGSSGVPVLGICYGMFTMAVQQGGEVEAEHAPRVRLRRGARARPHRAAEGHRGLRDARRPRHAQGVDEPRRQGHRAAARLQADGLDAELPDRRHGRRGARLLRRAVPPRGHAHRSRAASCSSRFVLDIARREPDWVMRDHVDRGGGAHPRAGRRRGGDPRPVGRRRLERRRGADPPRDRRPAHLRVRRPRPAAPGRGPHGDGHVRAAGCMRRSCTSMPASSSSAAWPASADPEAKRKIIGREFVEVFQAEARSKAARRTRAVAGAGHDLSRT